MAHCAATEPAAFSHTKPALKKLDLYDLAVRGERALKHGVPRIIRSLIAVARGEGARLCGVAVAPAGGNVVHALAAARSGTQGQGYPDVLPRFGFRPYMVLFRLEKEETGVWQLLASPVVRSLLAGGILLYPWGSLG